MAKSMILTIASPKASSTRTIGWVFSSGSIVSAAPNTREKKMIPSMSSEAAALIGMLGTMFTNIAKPNFPTAASWCPWAWARGKFGVDMFVNIVPSNPIRAAASLDMLGIIFFSLVFGAALTMLPEEKTQPMVRVLDALGEAIVKIIDFAMRLAPYGVFGLIFVVTSRF